MSDDPAFRCPVCRARQTLRETCRRCQADLRLLACAHRRVDYVRREREQARVSGNRTRAQFLAAELHWLVPAP